MKFKYKKFSSTILRPIIPVGVGYGSQFIQYEVLVDSGADVCIFDAEIGEALGKNGYGIVGQKGFFETFTVKFDLAKETLELKEHQR